MKDEHRVNGWRMKKKKRKVVFVCLSICALYMYKTKNKIKNITKQKDCVDGWGGRKCVQKKERDSKQYLILYIGLR